MDLIRTLLDRQATSAPLLPEDLRALYGGDLHIPASIGARPYVIGNFVSTLDGVVSFAVPGHAGGGDISGFNSADRFIMGLLRASADAVIVGAATLDEVSQSHLFIGESIYRAAADSYARFRREILGKPQHPITVIVTGKGNIDLRRAVFQTPGIRTVILTTEQGHAHLSAVGAQSLLSTDVRVIPSPETRLPSRPLLELLQREYGVCLLLHEGGPALFGGFVAEGLVDEFFITIAPQLAGRNAESRRPGMISGIEFLPGEAPWLELISVKQSGNHLYLRYRKRG